MKTNQSSPAYCWKLNVLLTVLLLLGGAAAWWLPDARAKIVGSDLRIKVVGTLPARDLAEIRHLVRREKWRGVLPHFSWSSIRAMPAEIRTRLSERTSGIRTNSDSGI